MSEQAERAFKGWVRPLAILFAGGGLWGLLLLFLLPRFLSPQVHFPDAPSPFFDGSILSYIKIALLLCLIAAGAGLFRRSRIAWYAALLYFFGGPLIVFAAVWLNPRIAEYSTHTSLICGSIISFLFGSLIYFKTRPVFVREWDIKSDQ